MEDKKFIIENEKGPEVKEMRLRYKVNSKDCYYSDYMLSGPQILQFAIDALTDFTVRRDDGDGSMLANTNANYRASLHGGYTIEVIAWLEGEGNRSRTYGYNIYQLIKNHPKDDFFEVLDEPKLVSDGTLVCVVKKPRK